MALTKVPFSMIDGATVNVLDFGAVADGNGSTGAGTDNSPAFQAALNFCQANNKTLYVPAGAYVLRSQVTFGNQNRMVGAGMYRTILIAPNTFTNSGGLLRLGGAGGPPASIEHLAVLGATATGAGAGSTGVALVANATLAKSVWVGGFATQFLVGGTDSHCVDCWADVSLPSGTGFVVTNGSNVLLDCTTFNCYVGILIQGGWEVAEPDICVQILGCNIIQSGYSGITITNNARNILINNLQIHSPTATGKFTRDFITVDGGSNISINQVVGTFGNDQSSSTIGLRITGQPVNLSITNCSIRGCSIGCDIDQPVGLVVSGNQFVANKLGGFRLAGGGPANISITGNTAYANGSAAAFAANTSFGFWLDHKNSANTWAVSGNSAFDSAGLQYYGFYWNHTNNAFQAAFTGNSSYILGGISYSYNGAGTAKIINQATNASA